MSKWIKLDSSGLPPTNKKLLFRATNGAVHIGELKLYIDIGSKDNLTLKFDAWCELPAVEKNATPPKKRFSLPSFLKIIK